MDESREKIGRIFMPRLFRTVDDARDSNIRFVHYSSADSAFKILKSKKLLLRNSTLMNDFSEVQYGMECLRNAYMGPDGERLKELMAQIQDDLPDIFKENFDNQFLNVRKETYLLSISEHGGELEDDYGRLSMWRAYAKQNGVAFIFNNTPFLAESNALGVISMPVYYDTPEQYALDFKEVVDNIEANIEFLKVSGAASFHNILMHYFRFVLQSTKHPSFLEEKEWRVVYTPSLNLGQHNNETRVPSEIMSISGVPQRVYSIPFKNYPEEGFVGAELHELIDKVLIGPSADAYAISQALVSELTQLGIDNAQERVIITGIPLRH